MAGIFTRNPVLAILKDESLTPEDRLDQIFALHGRALAQGYVTKAESEAAVAAAVEAAKNEAPKDIKVEDTEAYKTLLAEHNKIKTLQTEDFAVIKPQYREMVYRMLDHKENHKAYKDQLQDVKEKYAEMFEAEQPDPSANGDPAPSKPQFGAPTQGSAPKGDDKPSFGSFWNFGPKKE